MTHRLLPLVLVLTVLVSSCKKHVTQDCLKAQIIRTTCASIVVQVLSDNTIGEDGWLDVQSNKTYDNVFNVANSCKIASEHKVGDTVYITIGKATGADCIHCALYDAAPKTSYDVTSIGNLYCPMAAE